jgi:hypothetical protein
VRLRVRTPSPEGPVGCRAPGVPGSNDTSSILSAILPALEGGEWRILKARGPWPGGERLASVQRVLLVEVVPQCGVGIGPDAEVMLPAADFFSTTARWRERTAETRDTVWRVCRPAAKR